jgi:hypothetical protein
MKKLLNTSLQFCFFQRYFDHFIMLLKYEKTHLCPVNLIMTNRSHEKISMPLIASSMILDGKGKTIITLFQLIETLSLHEQYVFKGF